jgi:hypothetical protein
LVTPPAAVKKVVLSQNFLFGSKNRNVYIRDDTFQIHDANQRSEWLECFV